MNSLKLELAPNGLATLTLTQGARGNPIDSDFVVDFKHAVLQLYDMPGSFPLMMSHSNIFGRDLYLVMLGLNSPFFYSESS